MSGAFTEETPVSDYSAPNGATSRRQTEPAHYIPNAEGGISFIPRRNADIGGMMSTKRAIQRMAGDTPLQLLTYLVDIHPGFSLAAWQALRLSAPPEGLKIVAVNPSGAQEGAEEQDDAGTAQIQALWDNLPTQIGGLQGLQETLTLSALLTGLPFVEGVPGPSGKGLRQVWPVDSLTIRFQWEGPDKIAVPYQYQRYPQDFGNSGSGNKWGYVRLNTERIFWRSMDTFPDDPYGRAPYAAALGEVLRDLAMMQDLTEAIHSTAYPVLGMPFNFAEMYKVAVEVYKINDKQAAAKWVREQFEATVAEFNKRRPGESLHYDSSGDSEPIILEGSAGFAALEAILTFLRQRITQALKSLPTLLGINDGSTQTYTAVEWAIYAAGLEALRSVVAELLVKIANLHLRLLGSPLKAKAVYEPIRTTDAMIDANTETVMIANAVEKRNQGFITQDQASQEVTGNDAVGEAPAAQPAPGSGGDGSNPPQNPGNGENPPPQNQGDATPDEQQQQQQSQRRRYWMFPGFARPKPKL